MTQALLLGIFLGVSLFTIFKVLAPFLSTSTTKEKVFDKKLAAKHQNDRKGKIDYLD